MKHPVLTRILTLTLAAMILLSSLFTVACADVKEEDPSDTSPVNDTAASPNDSTPAATEKESETAYTPDIEVKNYNCDFNITIGGTFEANRIFIEELNTTDALDTAVYERGVNIKDHLGVTCVLLDSGSWTEYSSKVIRTVQAGE